jgi:hypothetical protein
VLAPLAVNVPVCPEHIVASFTVTVGVVLTITVDTAVDEQFAVVPVTV